MRATLDDCAGLKKALVVMADLVDEGNFELHPDRGLSFQSMDTSHVCLVGLELGAAAFSKLDGPASIFGVKLAHLTKVFGCSAATGACCLDVEDDVLRVAFEDAKFEIKLLDIDTDRMHIPETTPDVVIEASGSVVQRVIRDLGLFGDVIRVVAGGNGTTSVRFESAGDIGTAAFSIPAHVAASRRVDSEFGTRYLATMCKAAGVGPNVVIHLTADMPLHVKYPIGDHGALEFWLAPKLSDDEDMPGGGEDMPAD